MVLHSTVAGVGQESKYTEAKWHKVIAPDLPGHEMGSHIICHELTQPVSQYNPRECDCDFCQKHGSAAISDKDGTLTIKIKDLQQLSRFRQGSNLAEFLICKVCGVFVTVCFDDNGKIYGTINSRTVKNKLEFGKSIIVSPEKLSNDEKIQRWKMLWFPNVHIENGS